VTVERIAEDRPVAALPAQRLCNEIQLFDLCDLETCSFKEGRFCANAGKLAAFERISDAVVVRPEVFISEELEEGEEDNGEEYDDAFDDDESGDEAGYDDED
jgi:hypothetical protein